MKRLMFPVLILVLVAPAAAQTEPPGEGPHPVRAAARAAVIEFLDLDSSQIDAWDTLWLDHRDAEQPLRQQASEIQERIEEIFTGGEPDPTDLGLLMIERRDIAEALTDIHLIYNEGFAALLDEEQSGRLRQIRTADRIKRFIPAFEAFELVRR
jgi:hypothetical protein